MAAISLENLDAPPVIVTLGEARVIQPGLGDSPSIIGPGKPLALLAYLSASPGRTATREHLLDLLWADVELDAGRHALRQTVWYIRQRIHSSAIAATRDAVALHGAIQADRDAFLDAAARQDYEAAVEHYGGEFLPNLAFPGGAEFEHWLSVERRQLRRAFLRCGDAVVRGRLKVGRSRDAVTLARRLRDTDSSLEWTRRLLLESLVSADDRVGAATEADALAAWLEAEAREPEPATRALLRSARSSSSDGAQGGKPHAIVTDLIGRAKEFSTLVSAWDEARAHGARHIHLVAPAGGGKTRLLRDLVGRLRARRARLGLVSARPGDRSIPCASLGEIAAAVGRLSGAAAVSPGAARVLVALHPPLSSTFAVEPDAAQGEEAVRRRAIALHELIAAVCDEAPIALIIDDVHWMDDASRRILMSVLQRIQGERILIVTTSRPRYPFAGPVAMEQIGLSPLTVAQVGALVANLGVLPDAPWATRFADDLHAATGGTPLLLLDTLRLLIEQNVVAIERSVWTATNVGALRETLAAGSALRTRLARLTDIERDSLLLLAAAGVPLVNEFVARSMAEPLAEGLGALESLEQRGLVAKTTDGWQPGHDAVGEMVLDGASDNDLRSAHARLAKAYAARPHADSQALYRAGRHFRLANDASACSGTFVRWAEMLRRDHDGRAPRELAREFLGAEADDLASKRLWQALPLHLRFSRRRVTAISTAITLGVALFLGYAAYPRTKAVPPDATLYAVYADSGEDTVRVAVEIRRADVGGSDFIEVRSGRATKTTLSTSRPFRISPDGRYAASDSVFADTGGQEVVMTELGSGRTNRVTTSAGDDGTPVWSPDGKQLAFVSGRYDALGLFRIATIDVQSRVTRRLTHGSVSERSPSWSPDGALIAFARSFWDGRADQLCTATVDGSDEHCIDVSGLGSDGPIGWRDTQWIIVQAAHSRADSSRHLYAVSVRAGEIRPLNQLHVIWSEMSPDGRWVLCRCRTSATATIRWWVFPMDAPDALREVVRDKFGEKDFKLAWLATPQRARYVTSIRLAAPERSVPLTTATQLSGVSVDRSGDAVSTTDLRWKSLDTTVATIGPESGRLEPRDTGTVRVVASAGGWAEGQATIRVSAAHATAALTERWSEPLADRFVPFGDPLPSIVGDTPFGRALSHNGDASYPSGVYTRQVFDGVDGLGFEAVVSTPLTRLNWQSLSVGFMPDVTNGSLQKWDHRTGSPPLFEIDDRIAACAATVPFGEGPSSGLGFGVGDAAGSELASLPPVARTGAQYRLRIQLFPDGRCGFAIDGRAVATTRRAAKLASSYRIVLSGQMFETRILIGSFELWQGVKSDIDWRKLERR